MDFTTQRELLEHIGKNPNDRSLVQRMITAWKVWRNGDWTWHLEEEDVERVRRENEMLKEKLKEKSEWKNSEELASYKKWLDEANAAYEELESESEKKLDEALERCFNQMSRTNSLPVLQAPTLKEFKKWALGIDTSDTDSDFVDLPF